MGPLLVVEGQISPNPFSGLSPILVCLQVHLLVLDAAPQPFHEDVVHAPAPAVHAHLNALRQQHAGEGLAGELAALVGVEALLLAIFTTPVLTFPDFRSMIVRVNAKDYQVFLDYSKD